MIKFFRKIRQKLLSENKFSKYLIYAIGEIVLVVIGILIALYINNQNEIHKSEQQFTSILKEVHRELAENIKVVDQVIVDFKETDSIIHLIMHNKLDSNDYKIKNRFNDPASYYNHIDIDDKAIQKLVINTDNISLEYNSLITQLKRLSNSQKKYVDDCNEIMAKKVGDFYEWKKINTGWFHHHYYRNKPLLTDDEIKFYFSKESPYKNFMFSYDSGAFDNQLPSLVDYRYNAYKIYKELTKTLALSANEIESFSFKLTDKEIQKIIGTYQFDDFTIDISHRKNKLYWQYKDEKKENDKLEVIFITNSFFCLDRNRISTFKTIEYDKDRNVVGMTMKRKDFKVEGKKK
jgi:hypothetical protein